MIIAYGMGCGIEFLLSTYWDMKSMLGDTGIPLFQMTANNLSML
jgi:hypothetical protein